MSVGDLYVAVLLLYSAGMLSVFLCRQNIRIANYVAHRIATLGSMAAVLCAIGYFVWQCLPDYCNLLAAIR